LDLDVKINKYVAGGVAAYDLATGQLKWHTHLDLTTDEVGRMLHRPHSNVSDEGFGV